MSTSGSKSDNAAGTSKSSNIGPNVTALAGSKLTPQAQLVVCHNETTAMAFHAISHTGLVCTKCFKLYTPGSFAKHVHDCDDTLPASTATIREWKDTASLWADMLCKKGPKNSFFVTMDKIWAVKQDQQVVYFLHLVDLQEKRNSRPFVSQMLAIQCVQSMQ